MSTGIAVAIGVLLVLLTVPLGILVWGRVERMLSGGDLYYDGPLAGPRPSAADWADIHSRGEGLTEDEARVWDELTGVVWQMPSHNP